MNKLWTSYEQVVLFNLFICSLVLKYLIEVLIEVLTTSSSGSSIASDLSGGVGGWPVALLIENIAISAQLSWGNSPRCILKENRMKEKILSYFYFHLKSDRKLSELFSNPVQYQLQYFIGISRIRSRINKVWQETWIFVKIQRLKFWSTVATFVGNKYSQRRN